MQKPALTAPQVAGLLVGLLGTTLAVRWVLQVDAIARVIPGARYTGIVNPLLFMVAGLCLFNASPSRPGAWLARLAAVGIAALTAMPLACYRPERPDRLPGGPGNAVPGGQLQPHAAGHRLRTFGHRCRPVDAS